MGGVRGREGGEGGRGEEREGREGGQRLARCNSCYGSVHCLLTDIEPVWRYDVALLSLS